MSTKNALARGNEPHSATSNSGLAADAARKFEQGLLQMVEKLGREEMTPVRFREFLGGMRALLAAIGRETIVQILEAADKPHAVVAVSGRRARFRELSKREWLTAFGKVTVQRRTYRADGIDGASVVPLDDACGMRGRFMTADVEEMAALGMAMLTAAEVEQILAKALPEGPSATAIQNAAHERGEEIATHRAAIEAAIDEQAPLSAKGDILVVSYDGVMTPMREAADVAWREAGVATVSIYGQGKDGPEKRDTRFLARMPEGGMKTLLAHIADQVVRAKLGRSFREFAVICDGKDTIWSAASSQPVLHDAVWILDFYHAAENLMKAAVAIFGEGDAANRWHAKLRDKLLLDGRAVDNTIRTMRRCLGLTAAGSKARNIVDNAIKYFRFHRDRMRYSDFIARGLPIGSGPVEAAAKNIVQARLKRSGMRWSRDGGQHVLDLRAFLKSGRWEPMWDTLTRAA
jgi:Uncharacterised protein family (UPF0236)